MKDSLDNDGTLNEGLSPSALKALFALTDARPESIECWPHPKLDLPRPDFMPWPIPDDWQGWCVRSITVAETTATMSSADLLSQIQESVAKSYAEERVERGLPVVPDTMDLPDDVREAIESGKGGIMPAEVTTPIILHALINSIWPLLSFGICQLAGGLAASDDHPKLLQESDKERTRDLLAKAAAYLTEVIMPRALAASEAQAEAQQLDHLGREAAKL